ncbi:MAG: radical SAM protein [Candidatus Omnitrophica bacterium]|nr:radical SAM protein [Candidatus Omnitrophota bacterium]
MPYLNKLILIITHWCNLDCVYCHVLKEKKSMTKEVAKQAVDIFISEYGKKKNIRFFGGEPLLKFNLIKAIVKFAKRKAKFYKKSITFDITTNGIPLNDKMINFIQNNPEIELIISLDGDRRSHLINRVSLNRNLDSYSYIINQKRILKLPKLTVNIVAAPNQVEKLFHNFVHIFSLGFRRFNFLPAYFILWRKEKLRLLKQQFQKIADFILQQNGYIYIKNFYLLNKVPLFNDGLVIDYNGDIFPNNLILSRHFIHLRNKIILGNIKEYSPHRHLFLKPRDISYLMKREANSALLESTQKVDRLLTDFVNLLKNETSRY